MSFIRALFTVVLNNTIAPYRKHSNLQHIEVVCGNAMYTRLHNGSACSFHCVFSEQQKTHKGFLSANPQMKFAKVPIGVFGSRAALYGLLVHAQVFIVSVRLCNLSPLICNYLFSFSKFSVAI